jgi:excinuclease ABC subunit A
VLKGVCHRNIKNQDLELPLERFVAITGVSGSGKSSLIFETLLPALNECPLGTYRSLSGAKQIDNVVHIDQSPIGRTPRSTPATYCGLFDEIRALFASLPESKAKGWTAGRFSFNVKEGSCITCEGMGQVAIDMDFLETAWVQCPTCGGRRFDTETLLVRYKGHSILDVLNMTCQEAYELFSSVPAISSKLKTLLRVGLEYIQLGQSATTLSGGEAQRVKMAKELSRRTSTKTLYLLDEPTTGLHVHDISALLNALHDLVARGNTVVVIEHNMELIKTADWIIDMGPGGGLSGGTIIAQGSPSDIASLSTPTGNALRAALTPQPPEPKKKAPERPSSPTISIRNARQHTLKNLSLEIPKNALTAIVGPSGSGKSSLAFDTLFAEGQRQYVESLPPYVRQYIRQMEKAAVDCISGLPPMPARSARATGTHEVPSVPSRRSTTTCACSGPGLGFPTAQRQGGPSRP